MNLKLRTFSLSLLILFGVNMALANNEPAEFPSMGLVLLDSGETIYATVRGDERQRRQVREGYMDIGHCYNNGVGVVCSKYLQARRENILYPVESLTTNTQGIDRQISSGEVVLTEDNIMMAVLDVFPDGRIVAVPVYATGNPGYAQYRDAFAPINNAELEFIHIDSIKAVSTDRFGDYQAGDRLVNASFYGVPICEMSALRSFVNRRELQQDTHDTPCQHSTYYIHAMFTDGTFAKGSSVLNPFPENLDNYINSEIWEASSEVSQ